jgi:hypothetical protein
MKAYGGVDVLIHIFLTSALVSFTLRPLYTRERAPLPVLIVLEVGGGGPQNRSGRYRQVKILDPTGARTPAPRSSSP